MSEKGNPNFSMRRAAVATGLLAGGAAVVLTGQAVNNANHDQQRVDDAAEHAAEVQAYHDSIEAAVNAAYDKKAVIDEINIVQGTVLIDEAEAILKNSLGEDVYNANREHLYDYLLDSAKLVNAKSSPQPGEKVYVVEVDLDPENENGNEYIVTDGSAGFTE